MSRASVADVKFVEFLYLIVFFCPRPVFGMNAYSKLFVLRFYSNWALRPRRIVSINIVNFLRHCSLLSSYD